MIFVDANVFLRYLTGDDPVKAQACFEFFQRLKRGDEEATTSEAIVAEIVYVLSSPRLYNLTHADVRARLAPVLAPKGLRLRQKNLFLKALDWYAGYQFLDFEDALALAHMEQAGIRELASYDQDFDRIPGIVQREP